MEIQSYPKQTDAIQQLVVGRADATITQDTEAAFRESCPTRAVQDRLHLSRSRRPSASISDKAQSRWRRHWRRRSRPCATTARWPRSRRPGTCRWRARTTRQKFPARHPKRPRRRSDVAKRARGRQTDGIRPPDLLGGADLADLRRRGSADHRAGRRRAGSGQRHRTHRRAAARVFPGTGAVGEPRPTSGSSGRSRRCCSCCSSGTRCRS